MLECGAWVKEYSNLAADGLKVISKEILIPSGADKPIFWAAPIAFVATGRQ